MERRDPDFDAKMVQVLHVYKEVELLKIKTSLENGREQTVALLSYDEKPGIQAIKNTSPDLMPGFSFFTLRAIWLSLKIRKSYNKLRGLAEKSKLTYPKASRRGIQHGL